MGQISELTKICGEVSKEKGFDLQAYVKQLLLISNEVYEAFEHVNIGSDTNQYLLDNYYQFVNQNKNLITFRKNIDLSESSNISSMKIVEELADIVIRVLSLCGGNNWDLETAIVNKIEKNKTRPVLHGNKF